MKEMTEFENVAFRIIDSNGERWVSANQVGEALGYEDTRAFRRLCQQMEDRGELRKGRHFMILPLKTAGGAQETLVLSHRGVIRTAMRSDAPRAVVFRDWAEEVLFEVMTRGFYYNHRGWEYVPPSGANVHWYDMLSPDGMLRLVTLRAEIMMKLADRPRNRALWYAYYNTWGGLSGYARHIERINDGRSPQNHEEWLAFERELEQPWAGEPGHWGEETGQE